MIMTHQAFIAGFGSASPSTDFYRDELGMWWWRRSANEHEAAATLSREGFSSLDLCSQDASRFARFRSLFRRSQEGAVGLG
jgi:hypothetical protein